MTNIYGLSQILIEAGVKPDDIPTGCKYISYGDDYGMISRNDFIAAYEKHLMPKAAQPTDTEMLDWLVKNASWVADIFYVTHIEGRSDDEYPTTRQLIAAEMAKEAK